VADVSALLQLDEPTPISRRAVAITTVSGVAYVGLLAWALPRTADPLTAVAAVPLAHAIALAVVTGLTAFVLWLEAARSRRRGYLVLGGTFSSITVLMGGFIVSFPSGIRTAADGTPVPVLGGTSTAASFFLAWHMVLAAGVAASAIVLTRDVEVARRPTLRRLWPGVLLGVVPATALTTWWLLVPDAAPPILSDGTTTAVGDAAFAASIWLGVLALVVTVVATRGRSVIARWLIAICVLNVGDAWLNLDAERYSLGWYVARGVGFVALSAMLFLLVWELSRLDRRMQEIALQDTLTGTRARVTFTSDAEREIARADRDGSSLGLLWLDLDVFKQVNDRFGHATGDALLVEVGRRVRHEVRDCDLVVRMGGDEFGVLLVGLDDDGAANAVAERIGRSLRQPFRVDHAQLTPRASIGVAVYPGTAGDVEELVHQADVAMYAAKSAGGDRWTAYDPAQDVGYTSKATLRRRLDLALATGQLDLDAQPIVSAVDGSSIGCELLLRWEHDGARVSGAPFALEAERMGRSADIAGAVLDRLGSALPGLMVDGSVGMVSINLCVPDLLDPGILSRLTSAPFLEAAHVLVLEVTESAAIDDAAVAALGNLELLRARGYRLALDDFGVGFSNIVRLQQLRPDVIKIDRSLLVRASSGEPGAVDVLAWATSIGRTLGALTLVEGVETEVEAELVRGVGAELAQGYWFGRPAPLAQPAHAHA
jgi:diguanylate cyclase (GGDEF)-like protein